MGLTPYDLRNAHKGETIYVIGSGATLNHIDPSFFADKTCVGVNLICRELGLTNFYAATHYHLDAVAIAAQYPDLIVATPETDQGGSNLLHRPITEANVVMFPTGQQQYGSFNADQHWPTEPDHLVIGPTSLHFTMHFAAWLGAAHIVLVGADCGTVDGEGAIAGHAPGDRLYVLWDHTLPSVANKIRALGVGVHSLNPFVNLALEGHTFEGAVRIN